MPGKIPDRLSQLPGPLLASQVDDGSLPLGKGANQRRALPRWPQLVRPEDILRILPMDTAKWECLGGAMAYNLAECLANPLGGGGSIKMTADAVGASAYINSLNGAFAPALALQSGDVVVLRFYVHAGAGDASPDGISKLSVYLYTAPTPGGGDYTRRRVWVRPAYVDMGGLAGWYEVAAVVDDFVPVGAGVTLGNINAYRLHLEKTTNAKTPSVTWDRPLFYRPRADSEGFYIIRPDTSNAAYTAAFARAMAAAGRRASIGIEVHQLGTADWPIADALSLERDGHEIVCYTGGSPYSAWAQKTAAQKLALLQAAHLAWMDAGLDPTGAGILHLSGSDPSLAVDRAALAGLARVISSDRGYREAVAGEYPLIPLWNPRDMPGSVTIAGSDINLTTLANQAALAVTARAGIVVVCHVADPADRARVMEAVGVLAAAGLKNRTFGQLLRGEMDDGTGQEAATFFRSSDITGAEAETLTNGSDADAKHTHGGKLDAASVLRARVSAQFDKNNATLADVPGLSVALAAGKTYAFRAKLFVAGDAGGVKVAMAGTATATAIRYDALLTEWDDLGTVWERKTALGGACGWQADGIDVAEIEGCITVNAAGTLTVQFAQQAADGTSSVLVGSHLIVHEIL